MLEKVVSGGFSSSARKETTYLSNIQKKGKVKVAAGGRQQYNLQSIDEDETLSENRRRD